MTFSRIHQAIDALFFRTVSIAPLVVFRVLFGTAMCISTARFVLLGWVEDQYIRPSFHFSYYGFEWVQVLPPWAMYGLYGVMFLASIGIAVGWYYRWASVLFFLSFTYTELIDKTYYLNHYYFVSLVALLLCFVPAHRFLSFDVQRNPKIKTVWVPAYAVHLFQFQLACVYFFAGVAKVNYNWLFEAMPLRIWLPANDGMPLIGFLLREDWVAYVFSWVGMMYDLSIPFLLLNRRTRPFAYCVLLVFHGMTGYFFQIGVFPLVMSLCTLIFFPDLLSKLLFFLKKPILVNELKDSALTAPVLRLPKFGFYVLVLYLGIQLLMPWRYLLYPGNLFWTEEGFRYSWRVMLVEKAGTAYFQIKDNRTGEVYDIINRQFLNTHQEKQMSFQPDMMLQYAHYLGDYFKKRGLTDISVYCRCYVTMNGAPSKLILDPTADLLKQEESLFHKTWILPY